MPLASATIPHGLPGAIRWAAFAVTRALEATFGAQGGVGDLEPSERAEAVCPFGSLAADPVLTLASRTTAREAAGTPPVGWR